MQETKYWIWHLISSVVILILLSIHMITNHLSCLLGWFNPLGGEPTEWGNILARGKLFFYGIMYVLLLASGLYHGLFGSRKIIFELGISSGFKKLISIFFIIIGVFLFIIGCWATFSFYFIANATF
ncbi:hypothetical protein OAC89_06165 [Deltaproteobacteria bacterium]|nr:hypothetical protein [Deltaproteobacteria bacterium]